jgi:hypothetical protein
MDMPLIRYDCLHITLEHVDLSKLGTYSNFDTLMGEIF